MPVVTTPTTASLQSQPIRPQGTGCGVRLDGALLEQIAAGIASSPLWRGQIEHDRHPRNQNLTKSIGFR